MEKDKNRKQRRAYLNDFKKTEDGKYVYEGSIYRQAGDEKTVKQGRRNMLISCTVLICSVVLSGFLPAPGLKDSAFVLLPYAAELIASVSCCVAVVRILLSGFRLRQYVYETTVGKLPGRAAFAAVSAGASVTGECIYLFLNPGHLTSWFVLFFFVLEAASLGGAMYLWRELKSQKWEKI